MKLSLRINTPDDSSGANDGDSNTSSDHPDIKICSLEKLSGVLEEYLAKIYPVSKNFEFAEISITFMNPEEIRELNRNYRNINEPTDVLSFPMINDEPVGIPELPVLSLGDIVICPEEVRRLHPELNSDESMCLMIAHSFLHLLGFDHDTDEKQATMWEKQDEIKSRLLEAYTEGQDS